MIYGNLDDAKSFKYLPETILKVFEYALNNDVASFKPGSYEIDSDKIFVNVVEYDTKEVEERFWEAHKKYLDVHVIFSGNERINLNFIQNLKKLDYVEKDDFLPLEGEYNSSLTLKSNDFLVCYPEDAHMTALKVKGTEKVKKAIFKISLEIL